MEQARAQGPKVTRAEWLQARRKSVGASDVPAILGLSPWASPMSVWAEKVGIEAPPPENEELLAWGLTMEPAIAAAYQRQTGRRVAFDPKWQMRHYGSPCVGFKPNLSATLDGITFRQGVDGDDRGPLEFKNVDGGKWEDWLEGPPLMYQAQVQAQIAVMDAQWGAIAASIGGRPPVCFDLERDDAFIAAMLDAVADFWQLVETRTPPPPDGTDATKRALARIYPRHKQGLRKVLPPEAEIWFRMRQEAKAAIKIAQAQVDEAEAEIKAAMGDAEIGEIPGAGEVTWKAQEQAAYEVKAMTKRVLRVRGESV